MADLSVELASLALRNPILSASGTFGHGLEMEHFSPPHTMGGLVSKTVTLRPRPGNTAPRIHETEAGFLNSIGLENRGIGAYLRDVLPRVADADTRIFTNIGGEEAGEFAELASMLDERDEVDALEVNLSCPNVGGGRLPFSTDPALAERVMRGVREATDKPVFAKLSPNVTRIGEIARGAEAGGADGVTAVNTLLGMAVDWRHRKPRIASVQAGYSGTGIKPVALRCAWECARAVDVPVIGCGGVGSAEDVLEFVVAGCSAVQVGTAAFSDPALPGTLAEHLDDLLEAEGVASVRELVGSLDREGRAPA
ncbi:MAG: dihydroorotate dehydrogenase [Planctomycetota bacterium]|jgi:dihydroorotate dehydrogenase (NAD+) catalytic subunit|nr:dihydroorotate dehydrogenase [Planctomycetota bacterium]MDP6762415.1 dihydroorotate dehydrogenase [Planctomycetota bacterium]MDP6989551.1 dihydroorotate dehydrogenase [Planctomycetota bacterium]